MSYYNIVDLLILFLIGYFSYVGYQKRYYAKIFEYFRLFILITISAKLSTYTATLLQQMYITKADTYSTLLLISFGLNLIIVFSMYKFFMKLINKVVQSDKIKTYSAYFISFFEILILVTFGLYLIMQLYLSKVYLYKHIHKTYLYPKIEKFYKSFLGDEFVKMVMSSDTGTNHKEVIFKSFKNAIQ